MKRRAVIFDLGKVLLDFDYGILASRMAEKARLGPSEIRAQLDQSPLLLEYEAGRMTSREFYEVVCGRTGYRGEFEEFGAIFGDIFAEIPRMIAVQRELRQLGIPTFIFSNTNELAIRHIRSRYPFFSDFDGYILSYESGANKPSTKIYEDVERKSGVSGRDLLYIDDRPENIATGVERRWQTVLHEGPDTTIPRVRKWIETGETT